MKNRSFEDKIKKKLEGFEADYEPNQWLAFKAHAQNAAMASKIILLKQIAAIAAGLMILVGGAWLYTMEQDQLTLQNGYNTLAQKQNKLEQYLNSVKNKIGQVENQNVALGLKVTSLGKENTTLKMNNSTLIKEVVQREKKQNELIQNYYSEINILKHKIAENEQIAGKNTAPNTEIENTVVLNKLDAKDFIYNEVKIVNESKINGIDLPKQPEYYKKPLLSLQNMGLRISVNSGVAKNAIIGGVGMEIFLDSRNFIGVGYQKRLVSNKFFEDQDNYKKINRYDFYDKYKLETRPNSIINDILVYENITEMPIRYGYLQPLKNDFYVGGTLGTTLSLNVIKKIQFSINENSPRNNLQFTEKEISFISSNYKPDLFSNIAAGFMAEKRWKKLAISAGLEQKFLTKKVDFDNEKSYTQFKIGARFMVF